MPDYGTISVDQAGDIGGNGISRFHFLGADGSTVDNADANGVADAIHAFYSSINQDMPPSMTYSVQPEVPIIDGATGVLKRIVPLDNAPSPIKGLSSTANYAAGTGIRVNLQTGTVLNGRRLRGAFYLVPLSDAVWTGNGSLNGAIQSALVAAVGNLIGTVSGVAGGLCVVHRPAKGTKVGGEVAPVQTWTIGSTPASLRSRRV
jgi:hypothetical protein